MDTIQPRTGALSIALKAVNHEYRRCHGCQREWPAEQSHCPKCGFFLGDRPLERIDWQLVPARSNRSAAKSGQYKSYEYVVAAALSLRIAGLRQATRELHGMQGVLARILRADHGSRVCAVAQHGWFAWTREGARRAFLAGIALRDRLTRLLPEMERALLPGNRLRWGIWIDSYVLPFGGDGPIVGDAASAALFDFEPETRLLVTEGIYRANRAWEQFVCVPVRRRGGSFGYLSLGHKRPSALDHVRVVQDTPFVGRSRALKRLDSLWRESGEATQKAALVAQAGSGKTRLVTEWLRRHPEVSALRANFSLFGGDVASFAAQLADLPRDELDIDSLAARIQDRIRRDQVRVLILDDLHWADDAGASLVERVVSGLPSCAMMLLLCARPAGRRLARRMGPTAEISLRPLSARGRADLAGQLGAPPEVADLAARLSRGNPLFVEQFLAWSSETGYGGRGPCPRNLHQVIAARLEHLEKVRLKDLRLRVFWHGLAGPGDLASELDDVESQIGLWLDRLETGDYAERAEVGRYLSRLERIDFELFVTGTMAGRARPRSSRLREAIERLVLGSSQCLLSDMAARARYAQGTDTSDLQRDASRFGQYAAGNNLWRLAERFFRLALKVAPQEDRPELQERVEECRRRLRTAAACRATRNTARILDQLEREPAVDASRLAEVWLALGRQLSSRRYFLRAVESAQSAGDVALAEVARTAARACRRQVRG